VKFLIYRCLGPPAGGLADRFKGVISCFYLALATGRRLLVNWTYPCIITEGIKPNLYKWTYDETYYKLAGKSYKFFPFIDLFPEDYSNYFARQDLNRIFDVDCWVFQTNILFIEKFIHNPNFANFLFKYRNKTEPELFSIGFNRLFKTVDDLSALIENFAKKPEKKIGVHVRLGGSYTAWKDFEFYRGKYDDLLNKIFACCDHYLENQAPNFLICSDNQRVREDFLARYSGKVIMTPGDPFHIDRQNFDPETNIKGFKQALLDFYLLGECDEVVATFGNFARYGAYRTAKKLVFI
jgi:hypothetical protein